MSFLTYCSGYKCSVTCFEVSSKGFISNRNHTNLNTLHKFLSPDLKRSKFKETLSSLAVSGSYLIWLNRATEEFIAPPFLTPQGAGTQGRANTRSVGQ